MVSLYHRIRKTVYILLFPRLRHTAASLWLGAGADPNVVQGVLGHATAAMTMDLYGHMVDANLWQAAWLVGGTTEASEPSGHLDEGDRETEIEAEAQ